VAGGPAAAPGVSLFELSKPIHRSAVAGLWRGPRLPRRRFLAGALLPPALWLLPDSSAAAVTPLAAEEARALKREGSVERRFQWRVDGGTYLGALSYCRVKRPASELFEMLLRPEILRVALPVTRDVQFADSQEKLRVVQGTFLVNGSYTLDWRPNAERRQINFWLDQGQPHDVEDVFGYFRVRPESDSSCVLTVALAVSLGESVVAEIFRGSIHDYMGRPARYIARYAHRQPKNQARRPPPAGETKP
jgi:hypothetical protein